VPEVLISGNHAEIAAWRRREAERITRERRPDLWAAYRGVAVAAPPA
jgi:tRNA (guanine37-N1)-methyltransferase